MRVSKKPLKKKKVVTQDMKTKFRRTQAWKKLRDKIRKEQKLDPITLKPLATSKDWRSMVIRLIKILRLMDKLYSGNLIIE